MALSRPRSDSVGPSWSVSAVWLSTTSSTTSRPAPCSASTMARNSRHRVGDRVARLGRHEAVGVVAPVVAQPQPGQPQLVEERPDRHQLDGGDAEPDQMVEDGRLREPEIGAAQGRRHLGMQLGQAADVRLVENGVVPGVPGRSPAAGGRQLHHHALGDHRRGVARVEAQRVGPIDQIGPGPVEPAGRPPWRRGRAATGAD